MPPEAPPDDTRRIGRITASYKPGFRGRVSMVEESSRPSGELTGDEYPLPALLASMFLCLGGLVYRIRRAGSRK